MEVAVGSELGWDDRESDAHLTDAIAPSVTLLGIADGFGDLHGGTPAAPAALANVRDDLRRRQRVGSFGRGVSPSGLRAILLGALDYANARLYAQSGSDDAFVGSGTSLTAVMIVGRQAIVGHVGDARAYLLRLGRLELLTADDGTFVDSTVPSAAANDAPGPRVRGLLWRSLGTQPKLEVSIAHVELSAGDQLMLCTDGVHRAVAESELGDALEASESATDAVARVLSAARSRGGAESGTLIVARDLLVAQGGGARDLASPRTLRVAVAIGVLAASLLSYGLFALRGGFTDHPTNLTSTDR